MWTSMSFQSKTLTNIFCIHLILWRRKQLHLHSTVPGEVLELNCVKTICMYVGFQVLTVMAIKSSIFWDIMPRSWRSQQTFLRNILLLCSWSKSEPSSVYCLFHARFFLILFFGLEDGGNMFFQTGLHHVISKEIYEVISESSGTRSKKKSWLNLLIFWLPSPSKESPWERI